MEDNHAIQGHDVGGAINGVTAKRCQELCLEVMP